MAKKRRPKKTTARHPRRGAGGVLATVAYLLVWALILAAPFVLFPTVSDSFRMPKLMVSEWLGLASLVALSLAGALGGLRVPAPAAPPWRRPVVLAAAPVALAATIGLFASGHPAHVRSALPDLWIGLACLVGWSLGFASLRLERLLAGLVLPASATAVVAILQAHDLYRPFEFTRGEEAERLGVTALAGNAGDLAGYLVLPCLVAQWRLARLLEQRSPSGAPEGGRTGRVTLWMAVLGLCLYGLAVTQTLTALAAVAVGSALLWLVAAGTRRRMVRTGAALAAVAAVVAVLVLTVAPLRERVGGAVESLGRGEVDTLLTGRTDGWEAALWMLREHPAAGVGHGAYSAEFVPAKLALLERGASFYRAHRDPFFANAHNELLEAAAEWGVLGLAALGWALWLLGRAVVRGAWRRGGAADEDGGRPGGGPDGGFAVASLVALGLLALGHFPFRLALVAFPVLLLLAWIFRTATEAAGAEAAGEGAGGGGREPDAARKRGRWLAAASVLLLLVALVLQTGRAADRIAAGKRLRVVQVMTERTGAAGGGIPPQVLAGNLRLLREARRLDPANVAVPVALGGQYLLSGRPAAAVDWYGEALELQPRSEIYLNLGRALQSLGRQEEAAEAYETAVRLNPRLRRQVPQ